MLFIYSLWWLDHLVEQPCPKHSIFSIYSRQSLPLEIKVADLESALTFCILFSNDIYLSTVNEALHQLRILNLFGNIPVDQTTEESVNKDN